MTLPTGELKKENVAILYADIAAYSRLTEQDEYQTHIALSERLQLTNKIIGKHRGKLVRLRGDSVMATFLTATDAVYCATEIQTACAINNSQTSDKNNMLFRIGLSFGDVLIDNGEPYGNEVNIATRLQELAEPGEIYLSERIHLQLDKSLPFLINFVKKSNIFNLKKPIKIYKIVGLPKLKSNPHEYSLNSFRIRAVNAQFLIKLSVALSAFSLVVLMLTTGLIVFEFNKNELEPTSISSNVNEKFIDELLVEAKILQEENKLIAPKTIMR